MGARKRNLKKFSRLQPGAVAEPFCRLLQFPRTRDSFQPNGPWFVHHPP
jgi:hypothetical protein